MNIKQKKLFYFLGGWFIVIVACLYWTKFIEHVIKNYILQSVLCILGGCLIGYIVALFTPRFAVKNEEIPQITEDK